MLGKLALQRTNVRFTHLTALAVMAALVVGLFGLMGSASAHPGTGVHIDFDDTDDIVKAGTTVVATIAGLGDSPSPGAATTDWTVELGLLIDTAGDGSDYSRKDTDAASIEIDTTGAPDSEYTITAVYNEQTYTRTLTVGDPGKGVGSVEVTLGQSIAVGDKIDRNNDDTDDSDAAAAVDVAAETGTAAHPDTINVVVSTKNSLGNPANDSDVGTIILFVDAKGHGEAGRTGNRDTADATGRFQNSVRVDEDTSTDAEEATAMSHFTVGASSVASIQVYAIVIGDGGTATSDAITLNFTGPAAAINLDDASDALRASGDAYTPVGTTDIDPDTEGVQVSPAVEGGITFVVSGTDSGNSPVVLTPALLSTPKITNSDGKDVTSKFDADGTMVGTKSGKVVVRIGTGSTAVVAGAYTVEIALSSDATANATADFHVAGTPANVEVSTESSTDEVELGSVITVTATVTDKDGIKVADGTFVDFGTGGALVLSSVGKVTDVPTKNGVATTRFIVSRGAGLAVIIVDASDTKVVGDVDASGTASISTAAEPAEAMPAEEASLSCLSETNSFSTWTCEVDSSASEVFEWVRSRGASAIHLWNGSAWVRYSVVEGATVPGSTDFGISQYSQLFISN